MNKVLERSRYLVLLAVFSTLAASAAAFLWGVYKTVKVLVDMVATNGDDIVVTIALIELMDKFLIAVALYIFSVGMYELFIRDLTLPDWLTIHGLHQIKGRLSSVIVLIMAIVFLERLMRWQDAQGTLFFGIAIAVVTGALIAFNYLGEKE